MEISLSTMWGLSDKSVSKGEQAILQNVEPFFKVHKQACKGSFLQVTGSEASRRDRRIELKQLLKQMKPTKILTRSQVGIQDASTC